MTRHDVVAAMEACEREGAFDCHVDPIPHELTLPVDETYHYVFYRTVWENIKYRLEKIFGVWPYTVYQNRCVMKTRYIGRENLKGLKAAVLTCNHVTKFDCLAVKYGAFGHRTFVVAADFNNMKGVLGELMRAGDMVPLNTTLKGKIRFNRVIGEILERKKAFLLVYPEAAMWWNYKKPRPFKSGAFTMAAKYHVPVVPQFITFADQKQEETEGFLRQQLTVHICPPIYPRPELTHKENSAYLCREAFEACRRVYEETYGMPLTYTTDEAKENV